MKKVIAILLTFMVFSSTVVFAVNEPATREPSAPEIILDVIIIRPGGIAATVIGTGFFIVSLPFTIPTGSAKLAAKKLIADPFAFTFMRPIGFDTADY